MVATRNVSSKRLPQWRRAVSGERRSENLENLLETPAVISQLNTSPVRKARGSHIQHT